MGTTVNVAEYPSNRPYRPGIVRRILRQPFLRFLLIGAAIFAASALLDRSRDSSAHAIVVDSARVQRLAELYRVQMGATPSPAELEYLIDSHVRDEILYREALKLGLDREDEIIRRRLVQKMEFLQTDLAAVSEPTDAALREYFSQHQGDFTTGATVSFTHIYFSADVAGDEGARQAAAQQLSRLATEDEFAAARLGDAFPLQQSYAGIDAQEAAQIFGRTPFIETLFSTPQGRWTGPVRSGYGWHLIFVSRRVPAEAMDFAEARERVREAYIARAKREADAQSYAALRARYQVLRTSTEGEP